MVQEPPSRPGNRLVEKTVEPPFEFRLSAEERDQPGNVMLDVPQVSPRIVLVVIVPTTAPSFHAIRPGRTAGSKTNAACASLRSNANDAIALRRAGARSKATSSESMKKRQR